MEGRPARATTTNREIFGTLYWPAEYRLNAVRMFNDQPKMIQELGIREMPPCIIPKAPYNESCPCEGYDCPYEEVVGLSCVDEYDPVCEKEYKPVCEEPPCRSSKRSQQLAKI